MAFGRRRPGLRGVPGTCAAHRPKPIRASPRGLRLLFRALFDGWDPLSRAPPLVGSVSARPPTSRRASTPRSRSSLRPDDATRQVMFRPRGFSPPRRFPPRGGSRACCIPQPVRVRRVSRRVVPGLAPPKWSSLGTPILRSPRRGSHPPKSLPRQQPYRLTTAVALLLLPSRPIPGRRRSDDLFRRPATEVAGRSPRDSAPKSAGLRGRRTRDPTR